MTGAFYKIVLSSFVFPVVSIILIHAKDNWKEDYYVNFKNKTVMDNYPDQLDTQISVCGQTKQLRLIKNYNLLSSTYKEVYFENGTRVDNAPQISKDFCYYVGTIDEDPLSHVAINLCDNKISGTVYLHGLRYKVMPNSTHEEFYLTAGSLKNNATLNYECDTVQKYSSQNGVRSKRSANNPLYYKNYVTWKELYIELAIVFDNSAYNTYNQDKNRLFRRAKELTSYLNSYYQPINIKVVLVGVEIWSESDPFVVTTNGDNTLNQFLVYRKHSLLLDIPNDHAQLLTSVSFDGGVVGKAMVGSICSSVLSGAAVKDHSFDAAIEAATMAHELGHNFGMEHDNAKCECPKANCLMTGVSSVEENLYWSSCSMEYLAFTLAHGGDACLKNKPSFGFNTKSPICGNGFVEDGEQCDCGFVELCDNKCCNATTCQFVEEAVCADGACCDKSKCQLKPRAAVCRESRGECDLDEHCNGQSDACPHDIYKHNGISCNNNQAYCYNGSCNSHDSQCKLIWGSTGANGVADCYKLNTAGDSRGNCGYKRLDKNNMDFEACLEQDTMCGLLHCSQRTEKTQYGNRPFYKTSAFIGSAVCHTVYIDLGSDLTGPGLVPHGAKCGTEKMCIKRKCLSTKQVLAETPCENDCSGNGICNNLGNCNCKIGFGGSNCASPVPSKENEFFFTLIGIVIFLIVLIPLVLGLVLFLIKRSRFTKNKKTNTATNANNRHTKDQLSNKPAASVPSKRWSLISKKPTITINMENGLDPVIEAIASCNTSLSPPATRANSTASSKINSTARQTGKGKKSSIEANQRNEERLDQTDDNDEDNRDAIRPKRPAPLPPATSSDHGQSSSGQEIETNPLLLHHNHWPVVESSQDESALNLEGDNYEVPALQQQSRSKPGLPLVPKPKVTSQEENAYKAVVRSKNNITAAVEKKENLPLILPPIKPKVVKSTNKQDNIPKPLESNKVLKPTAPKTQIGKDKKLLKQTQVAQINSTPKAIIPIVPTGDPNQKATTSHSSLTPVTKKAVVPPAISAKQENFVNGAKKSEPRKTSKGTVGALAARFEKLEN